MLQNYSSPALAPDTARAHPSGARWGSSVRQAALSTTVIERGLLGILIAVAPLEKYVPGVAGVSFTAFLFGILTTYVLWNRPKTLSKVWWHPVFRAGYFMIFVAALVESLHPYSSYTLIMRITLMIFGAVVVATLCRDRAALHTALHAFIVAGLGVAAFLIFKGYGSLQGAVAANYKQATQLRTNTFQTDMRFELGFLSFVAGQGVVITLALALAARTLRQRVFYMLCGLVCLVGTFMPLSRGGVLITAVACLTVITVYLLAHPGKQTRTLIAVAVLAATVFVVVPDAVFSRMEFSTAVKAGGKQEGRARIYTSAVTYFPEYVLGGVGGGNYWADWAQHTTFGKDDFGRVDGPHNSFIALTVYWGLAGFLTFAIVIWRAYRCIPIKYREDPLAICMYGLSVGWLMRLCTVHTVYDKSFAFGFGLLVASNYWIWRQHAQRAATARSRVLPASSRSYS